MTNKFQRRVRKNSSRFPGMLEQKRCGPPDKHGAYSQHVRERYSDLRTKEGQRLEKVTQGLIKDLSGPENISTAQSILIDTIRSKIIVIFQISQYAEKQVSIIDEETGEILKCLGRNFLSYSEALRRDLEALQKFSNNKLPSDLYEKWRSEFFKDTVEVGKGAKK